MSCQIKVTVYKFQPVNRSNGLLLKDQDNTLYTTNTTKQCCVV